MIFAWIVCMVLMLYLMYKVKDKSGVALRLCTCVLVIIFIGGIIGIPMYSSYKLERTPAYKEIHGVSDIKSISDYQGKLIEYTGKVTTKYQYKDNYFAVIDGEVACVLSSRKDYDCCIKGELVTIKGVCSKGEENILLLKSLCIE